MTALHDPDIIAHDKIEIFKRELQKYDKELWLQFREAIAQAFITGANSVKGGKENG